MSQKANTFEQSVPMEEGQSAKRWGIPILIIGLAALMVAIVIALATPVGKPIMLPVKGDAQLAANPELIIFSHYALPAAGQADRAFLAANPELMVARRHSSAAESEDGLFAANPELTVARRNLAPAESEAGFFAANPELMVARRYAAAAASAANPGPAEAPTGGDSRDAGGQLQRGQLQARATSLLKPGPIQPHPRQPLW